MKKFKLEVTIDTNTLIKKTKKGETHAMKVSSGYKDFIVETLTNDGWKRSDVKQLLENYIALRIAEECGVYELPIGKKFEIKLIK